jgi:rifampicin phosphotransferase
MKTIKSIALTLLTICVIGSGIFGQMNGKPSPSRSGREGMSNDPKGKRFLSAIKSQADFDAMSRTYNAKTPYALPHEMFVIDRRAKKIYYVNSQMYRFHQDFANAQYLSLKRGAEFFREIYVNDKRNLIVGTVAWQNPVQKFTFEFWEGDLIPGNLIKEAYDTLSKSFFTKVYFKPNTIKQEEAAAPLNLPTVTSDELSKNQEYLGLNTAVGRGRIHIIDKYDDTVEIGYNEIVVFKELPLDLPPVSGIILSQPSSPLSHINLLAKGWNIPNAYIKNANDLLRQYDGKWMEISTSLTDYKIKPCLKACLDKGPTGGTPEGPARTGGPPQFKSPPSNLSTTKLASIAEMRKKDTISYGSKAANLGEVINGKLKDFAVPAGFGIPFVYYKQFMEANEFDKDVDAYLDDQDFVHNPSVRRKKLEEFRAKIQTGKFDDKLRSSIIDAWKTRLGGKPVYVRSSSNAEDTGKFSGAGLYSSVENVTEEDKVIEAVKTVWASIWNFAAYEARERNFVEHTETYMAVLVQVGVEMENGGVMITKDPFDERNKGAVYISSTWGHNLSVTNPGAPPTGATGPEPKKRPIPEQILFTPRSNSIQVLTRSDQETMFVTVPGGGLQEVPFDNKRRVLNDAVARRLVKVANEIKKLFGGVEQDIEWGIMKDKIYVVQSRPYVEKK